jgi:hypothetical protein
MGCCNEPAVALTGSAPDPARHVNYAKGMVLGVDDFTQEFAYLAGRDQWLARDAIGYGTLSGLAVLVEEGGADGPRLRVAAGSAIAVSGKLICVPADQCCVLNKWLAKPENAATVTRLLGGSPPQSPPMSPAPGTSGTTSLYLTLCYADCLTAPVPIPGEPCRSEDDLMAPSRIADDFCLELRAEAPRQLEDDALRDFVKWLKDNVEVVDSASPAGDDATWLAALRSAARAWFDAKNASPPLSPPASIDTLGDFLVDLPTPLSVPLGELRAFLQLAFRFWVTELRPMWMARRCHTPVNKDQDCVLLARVEVPVEWVGGSPSGVWQVNGGPGDVTVDESTRPFIVHLRLLQEWMLLDGMGGGDAAPSLPQGLSKSDKPAFAGLTLTGALRLPFVTTSTNITLNASHHFVACTAPVSITLPKCAPSNKGRVYNVRTSVGPTTLLPSGADNIVGGGSVPVTNPKIVVSDGNNNWYVF